MTQLGLRTPLTEPVSLPQVLGNRHLSIYYATVKCWEIRHGLWAARWISEYVFSFLFFIWYIKHILQATLKLQDLVKIK